MKRRTYKSRSRKSPNKIKLCKYNLAEHSRPDEAEEGEEKDKNIKVVANKSLLLIKGGKKRIEEKDECWLKILDEKR